MAYYKLSNEYLEVELASLGGTLDSIRTMDGLQYLWQGDKKYWSGKAPVLFPICGSIRDDKAKIGNGKETQMPRHGIVRKSEFQFEGKQENSITFSIESNEETRKQFPYDYKLYTNYELCGKTIKVTYRVVNNSEEVMPFFVGGHPGFNCPLVEGESYEDYYLEFEQTENCSVPTPITETGLIDMEHRMPELTNEKKLVLMHELFHKDAIILDELKSRKVKLISSKSGVGVELDFADFPYLILWSTSNDGPFIALEPWTGLSTCSDESDIFEEKRNIQFVESGKEKKYSFSITVL